MLFVSNENDILLFLFSRCLSRVLNSELVCYEAFEINFLLANFVKLYNNKIANHNFVMKQLKMTIKKFTSSGLIVCEIM